MPAFKNYKKGTMKNTELLSKEIFSLPMYPSLKDDDLEKTISILKKICKS